MRGILLGAVVAALAGLAGTAAADQGPVKVGVTAAVNPDASGQPQAEPMRALYVGNNVMYKERITTGPGGQAQILFVDQSSLTVAPNSDVVIDEFVYDPDKNTGKMAATLTKGLFRYVGGRVSKDHDVTFHTPSAEIGIRGGVGLIQVGADGSTTATFIYGVHLCVGAGSQSQCIYRNGFQVTVAGPGQPPSGPTLANLNTISKAFLALQGQEGKTGGANQPPNDSQTPALNPGSPSGSGPPNQNFTPPVNQNQLNSGVSNLSAPPPPPPAPPPAPFDVSGRGKATPTDDPSFGTTDFSLGNNFPFAGATLQLGSGGQPGTFAYAFPLGTFSAPVPAPGTVIGISDARAPNGDTLAGAGFLNSAGDFVFFDLIDTNPSLGNYYFIFAGIPTPPPALVASGKIDAFGLLPDFMLGSNIPFIRDTGGGSIPNPYVSPIYFAEAPSGPLGDHSTFAQTTALQASFVINGVGPGQQSAIEVMTGAVLYGTNFKPIFTGDARATAMLSSTSPFVESATAVTGETDANGNAFFGATGFNNFVLDNAETTADANLNTVRNETPNGVEFSQNYSSTTQYSFNQVAMRTPTPSTVGTSRTDQFMQGYVGGLGQTFYGGSLLAPSYVSGGASQLESLGAINLQTFASLNRISAQIITPYTLGSVTGTATFNFGGVGNASDQVFGQLSAGLSYPSLRSSFIDDNIFGAIEQVELDSSGNAVQTSTLSNGSSATPVSNGHLYIISSGAILPQLQSFAQASGATLCTCQYLKWGFWGGDVTDASGNALTGHLLTWVAGPLETDFSKFPNTGTATYTGHMIGNVYDGTNQYLAIGNMSMGYSFSSRVGNITASFDGTNLTGATTAINPRDYTGTLSGTGTHGLLAGTLAGSFYSGGGSPVAETGGMFNLSPGRGNTNIYKASGIYALAKH